MPHAQQQSAKPIRKLWVSQLSALLVALALVFSGINLGPEVTAGAAQLVGFLIGYFVPPSVKDQIDKIVETAEDI